MSQLNDFIVTKKLGEGSFSSVYKVKRKSDNEYYAMKKVNLNSLNEKEIHNSLIEIRILASIKDKNIIGYKESFFDQLSNNLFIIMELASGGDLHTKI